MASGTTPLTEAVDKVIRTVEPMAAQLREAGQRVMVVIATDGHPNNRTTFLDAMRRLQQLPVLAGSSCPPARLAELSFSLSLVREACTSSRSFSLAGSSCPSSSTRSLFSYSLSSLGG